jgi:glycine/D-amino acid oxidase-like deaminating enzyme
MACRAREDAMLADLAPVEPAGTPPRSTEVVIIGGGIVGASAALSLAEAGVPTCLLEKGRVGGEQSGRNWGWVRKMGRPEADVDLSVLPERLWERLDDRIGRPTGYRKIGSLYLSFFAEAGPPNLVRITY